jgi:hypothetical protein
MTVLRRSRLVRLLVAIVLVALAAVGLRLSDDEDNVEVVRGVLGEPVSIHGGTVTVSDVRVATALLKFDKVDARTPGLFVVVRVQVAAIGTKPVGGFGARVLSGDRRYDGFGLLNTGRTEPGFEASLDVAFEVDPAGIDDLTLELYPFEVITGFHGNVRVHLGITPDNAGEWRAAGRDQSITTTDRTVRGI